MPVFSLFLLLTLIVALPVHAVEPADAKRLDEVTEREVHVMPFNLEKAAHFFQRRTRAVFSRLLPKIKPMQSRFV